MAVPPEMLGMGIVKPEEAEGLVATEAQQEALQDSEGGVKFEAGASEASYEVAKHEQADDDGHSQFSSGTAPTPAAPRRLPLRARGLAAMAAKGEEGEPAVQVGFGVVDAVVLPSAGGGEGQGGSTDAEDDELEKPILDASIDGELPSDPALVQVRRMRQTINDYCMKLGEFGWHGEFKKPTVDALARRFGQYEVRIGTKFHVDVIEAYRQVKRRPAILGGLHTSIQKWLDTQRDPELVHTIPHFRMMLKFLDKVVLQLAPDLKAVHAFAEVQQEFQSTKSLTAAVQIMDLGAVKKFLEDAESLRNFGSELCDMVADTPPPIQIDSVPSLATKSNEEITPKRETDDDADHSQCGRGMASAAQSCVAAAPEKGVACSAMKKRRVMRTLDAYLRRAPSDVIVKFIVDLTKGFLHEPPLVDDESKDRRRPTMNRGPPVQAVPGSIVGARVLAAG